MNVKIEKQENSKIVLEFTMPNDEFLKNLDKTFAKNAKYFKVPGFRNGKVPRNVIEKMYGEDVLYEEVVNDTVNDAFKNAVDENKLEVVSKPILDIKQVGKDKDLIYTVTCYVKPDVTVTCYKGIEIEKIERDITPEDVNKALDEARNKNARIVTVEDRALKENDISTIDFEGFLDGTAFEGGKGENFELTIGSGQFIPGFEEQLVGMNIGEEKEIKVTFPTDYHSEELSGKEATFKVKLISIKEKILPELDDEFAKDVSEFDTLEEYRNDVEKKVKERKENSAKAEKESKVIDKLVENTQVVIPESMIEDEIDNILERFKSNLAYQGLSIERYCEYLNTTIDAFKATLRPEAEKDVKLNLAFEFVAKDADIKVEDSEIDEKLEELVKSYGNDSTSDFKKNENARNYMKEKIMQEKVMSFIVDNAIEK